jgi:hypothetical protein
MKEYNMALTIEPVNRSKEISYIREILYNLNHKQPEFGNILNWYGIPGIGKSTLGIMAGNLCQVMGVPFSIVDFEPEKNPLARQYADNFSRIIEKIIAGFEKNNSPELSEELRKYDKDSGNIDEFISILISYLKIKPFVIVFDTTEQADEKALRWIEKNIVSPLCITGMCLIIWTGRFPQGWKQFEVRRRVVCQQLEALDIESTKQQIASFNLNVENAGSRIYRLTDGHPLGNRELVEVLKKDKNLNNDQLLKELIERVIDNYVMEDVPDDLREACRVLSIVRQFDVMILEHLLSTFVSDYFTKDSPYLTTIGRLTATSLVEWNTGRKGYSLNKTVRHILRQDILWNKQERFLAITEKTLGIYEEWIKKVSENRGIYILEWLYHQANLFFVKGKSEPEILEDSKTKLHNYLYEYYQKDESGFKAMLLVQLENDFDNDKEEFEKMIGKDEFEDIKKIITDHRQFLEHQEKEGA